MFVHKSEVEKRLGIYRDDSGGDGGQRQGSGFGTGRFDTLRRQVSSADDAGGGYKYPWQNRAAPGNQQRERELQSITPKRDEKRTGRSNWNGEDMQEMSEMDKFFSILGDAGDPFADMTDSQTANNLLGATVGSVFSPATAPMSALSNFYVMGTGRPIDEADDEGNMPDYELDTNERAAAGAIGVIDLAGLMYGGSKEMIEAGIRGTRYQLAKHSGEEGLERAAKIAQEALDEAPKTFGQGARKLLGAAASEGAEEGVQQFFSDVRYDQVNDGTMGRMLESAAWGAVGGVTMEGLGMGINALTGRNADTRTGPTGEATSSGNLSYRDFVRPEDVRGRADADIQDRIEKMQNEDKFVPGSTNYKVVQGRHDIAPDETIIGTRGLRKMYYESDESRKYVADSLGMSLADADAVFSGTDEQIALAVNEAIARNEDGIFVYLKREPHTNQRSYMKFALKEVIPGNAVMTNTIIPQMNGGDIDGDMMGLLWDTRVAGNAKFATAMLMDPAALPVPKGLHGAGLPGRYGKLGLDKDYLGFTLDDGKGKGGLRSPKWDVNGVNPIDRAFMNALGDRVDADGVLLREKWSKILEDAWNGRARLPRDVREAYTDSNGEFQGDSFSEFVYQLTLMREDIARSVISRVVAQSGEQATGKDVADAYAVADGLMSQLIHNLQYQTGPYLQISAMIDGGWHAEVNQIVNAVEASVDNSVDRRGTTGAWSRTATMMSNLNTIDQAFEMAGNTGLRFKQNMYWSATSSRVVNDALRNLPPAERAFAAIRATMRIADTDATPKRQMENLFRAYVARDVCSAVNMRGVRFDAADVNADLLVETFERVYNEYVDKYNDALKESGIDGDFKPITSTGKQDIQGWQSFCDAFINVFGTYEADAEGHTLNQVLESVDRGEGSTFFVDILMDAGKTKNDLMRGLIKRYGAREYAKGKNFEKIVNGVNRPFDVTWDANGNAVYREFDRPYIVEWWELQKRAVGLDVCHAYGLVNMESAINSRFGPALFGNDPDARLNAILRLRLQYKYRNFARFTVEAMDYDEQAASATSKADRKNFEESARKAREQALAQAKTLYGVSELDNRIVDEIVNDGKSNYLMNMVSDRLTYAEKTRFFEEEQKRRGDLSTSSLIENAARTDTSTLSASEFSNDIMAMRQASNVIGKNNREAAIKQVDELKGLFRDEAFNANDVVDALTEQMRASAYNINLDLVSTTVFDAADVLKGHVDKGASTPTEAELYQMLSRIYDTGAKSAINRITGTSMNAATMRELCQSKRDILLALSDPTYSKRVLADDGSGEFTLTQEKVFEAVGIKLGGRKPTAGDWMHLLTEFPQVVTWIGDSSFAPVPDSDTITVTSDKSVADSVRDRILGRDRSRYERERDAIKREIINDPNNMRVVLGIVGSRNPGVAFDNLLESPAEFRREFDRALTHFAEFEHSRLSGSVSGQTLRYDDRSKAYQMVEAQIDSTLLKIQAAANMMSVNSGRVYRLINDGIVTDYIAGEFSTKVLARVNEIARATGRDQVEGDVSQQLSDLVGATSDTANDAAAAKIRLQRALIAMSGRHAALLGAYDPSRNDKYVRLRRSMREIVTEDQLALIEQEVLNEPYADVSAGFEDEFIITIDDVSQEPSETAVRVANKIAAIKNSGKFSVYGETDASKLADELMVAFADKGRGEIERIANRFNSLVLTRLMRDVSGSSSVRFNRSFYYATTETMEQVTKTTEKLRRMLDDGRISVSSGDASHENIALDFTSPMTGILSDFAVSSLEGAGNSLMSGIEGGEYQQLISLSGLSGALDLGVRPRKMKVRDLEMALENSDVSLYGCRFWPDMLMDDKTVETAPLPKTSGRFATPGAIQALYEHTDADGGDTYVWVAPIDDSPIPDTLHSPKTVRYTGRDYGSLTNMLIEMVYDRSEPGVFKRKKDIGKFDEVVREIIADKNLGNAIIQKPTPNPDDKTGDWLRSGIVEGVRKSRRAIAERYYENFVAEKMDSKFGKQEALMLAQITTPAVRLTMGDGTVRYVAATALWDKAKFAALGIDPNAVSSIRIAQMPLSTVCAKVGSYVAADLGGRLNEANATISDEDIRRSTLAAFDDFSNFRDLDVSGVRQFMSMIAPLSRTHRSNVVIGRSALPPDRLRASVTGDTRGVARYGNGDVTVTSLHVDEDWRDAIENADRTVSAHDADQSVSNVKIAFANVDTRAMRGMGASDAFINAVSNRELHNKEVGYVANMPGGARPAYLVVNDDVTAYGREYAKLRHLWSEYGVETPVMIVPANVRNAHVQAGIANGSVFVAEGRLSGMDVVFVDPTLEPNESSYVGPTPDFFHININDIKMFMALDTLSDSPVVFRPGDDSFRHPIETIESIGMDVLFGDYQSLQLGKIELPTPATISEDLRGFRAAFDGRNNEDPKRVRFVYPKFKDNREMSKREVDAAVNQYLNRADSTLGNVNAGFIDTDVELGSCIGFVKVHASDLGDLGGEYVYAPVIINTGGTPGRIDTIRCLIDPSNADHLQFTISGNLTPSEIDGLKVTFPNLPYKAYGRQASMEEWERFGYSLAWNTSLNGAEPFDIDAYYSQNTEDGRLIDRGVQSLAETLYYSNLKTMGGLFITIDENGSPSVDYDAALARGFQRNEVDQLLNAHRYEPIWDDVLYGNRELSTDPDVNYAIRQVVAAVKASNSAIGRNSREGTMSPVSALSAWSLDNGKPVLMLTGTSSTDFVLAGIGDPDRLLKLFHFINPNLCPNGYSGPMDKPYLIDKNGRIRVKHLVKTYDTQTGEMQNDRYVDYYVRGHFMIPRTKHDSSTLGIPSRHGAFGNQQVINSIMERGFNVSRDIEKAIQLVSISNGAYTPYLINGRYFKESDTRKARKADPFMADSVESSLAARSTLEYNYDEAVAEEGQKTYYSYLNIVDNAYDKNVLDSTNNRLRSVYARFNRVWGLSDNASPLVAQAWFKAATGYSFNDGTGSDTVTIDEFERVMSDIAAAVTDGDGFPIKGGITGSRYAIPLLPRPIMRWMWENSGKMKSVAATTGLTFDEWVESAATEMDVSRDAIGSIRNNRRDLVAKRRALETITEYCYRTHGMGYRGPSLVGYYSVSDKIRSLNPLYEALEASDSDLRGMRERQEREFKQQVSEWKRKRDNDKHAKIETPMAPNGFVASWFGVHNTWWEYASKNLIAMSRMMSMTSGVMLPASAVISRAKGLGTSNAMLFLRTKGNYVIKDQKGLAMAAKSSEAREIWNMLDEIQMNTPEMDTLLAIQDKGDMIAYMRDYHEKQGRIQKMSRTVARIATADGAFDAMQIKTFVNYLAQNLPDNDPLLAIDTNGRTILENRALTDMGGLLLDTLTLRNNTHDVFVAARQARDVAMSGDFAQRTSYGMILHEVFKQHPIGEFLLTTGFLKWPTYMINSSGFFLNHIAPISSLYYWSTSKLIKKAKSENPYFLGVDLSAMDLESTQRYRSFKEACYADAANMGLGFLTAIILSCLGIEPPKDDEGNPDPQYMGNLNEWTILGLRIEEAWWLQDIMGPSLAMAAFKRSAEMGQPRLDLIGNWMSNAMWNNPLLRASDIAAAIFNTPNEVDNMIEEAELYENAKGGEPSPMEMLSSGALTFGVNYASQFFVPSIFKNFYRSSPDYESSYKRVYAVDAEGNIIHDEEGQPITVVTNYADQQKRKLARSNPFAALLFNITSQGETGYSTWSFLNSLFGKEDMPYTKYYQQDEVACAEYYSLYRTDENGIKVSKSGDEINTIAFEVLTVLEAEDDMADLRASGWVIPYETKAYVSQVIWDEYHYIQRSWDQWDREYGDYYLLGDGDYMTGKRIFKDAYAAKEADLQHLMDLYNKLWDENLTGISQYNRWNTTYQQDSYGNWYATGFKRGLFGNVAPGTVEDPGPTMGVTGNWETPSVNNPEVSAGGRALVPIDEKYTDYPPLSSWSKDGNGEDYSDMVELTLGGLAYNEISPGSGGDGDDRGSYPTNYGNRGGDGGGWYYRRRGYGGGGGGGGGGYTPNIYSHLPSVNMPYAGTMYGERLYDPNYDYIRPNFETKGSREAYKRSDI